MKKVIGVLVVAALGVGAWRWMQPEPAKPRDLIVNRFWIDHMPTSEKDMVNVFVLWRPESFGAFRHESHWRVNIERFRYELDGGKLRAYYPMTGEREEITLKAWRCDESEMDYCLELEGSKLGVKRYYSRRGWERRERVMDADIWSVVQASP